MATNSGTGPTSSMLELAERQAAREDYELASRAAKWAEAVFDGIAEIEPRKLTCGGDDPMANTRPANVGRYGDGWLVLDASGMAPRAFLAQYCKRGEHWAMVTGITPAADATSLKARLVDLAADGHGYTPTLGSCYYCRWYDRRRAAAARAEKAGPMARLWFRLAWHRWPGELAGGAQKHDLAPQPGE